MVRDFINTVKWSLLNLEWWPSSQGNNERKTKSGVSFIWLTWPIFSFIYTKPSLIIQRVVLNSESGPESRHFNSKHTGVGGRGVNHVFKFYGQGAFANKLPEPDGQIKGKGRKGRFLLKRSFKWSISFPSHLSLLPGKGPSILIVKVPGVEGKILWWRAFVPQLYHHLDARE